MGGQSSSGTGCPVRMYNLHLQRFFNTQLDWIKPWATCSAVRAESAVSRRSEPETSRGPLQPELSYRASSNIASHSTNTRKEWTWANFGCWIFFRCTSGVLEICSCSQSSKEASSFALSWQGCKDEYSHILLGKTASFTLWCLLKPYVPFNKIIIRSTDLGWFRCRFWISRKSLSYARKMVVDMIDWQPVCVCVFMYRCMHMYVHVWLQVCMCECVSGHVRKTGQVTFDF